MEPNSLTETSVIIFVVLQVFTFATLIYKDRAAQKREEQRRQWDLEDRAILAQKVADSHQETVAAIVENTVKTEEGIAAAADAARVANTVNAKIIAIAAGRTPGDRRVSEAPVDYDRRRPFLTNED